MINISEKTLQDLEFNTILEQIAANCNTDPGEKMALEIKPFQEKERLERILVQTSEYLSSFENDNRIPNHEFSAINSELKLLRIENTFLEVQALKKISDITDTTNKLAVFFRKFKEYYPILNQTASTIEINTFIIEQIDLVVDRFGEIKDNASETLLAVRKRINVVRGKINQSFASALTRYHNAEYLDDIRESVVENKRVLAVKSMHRRKVKGAIMGSSKTGSIVFIEPEVTLQFSRELGNLLFEEAEEIEKILRKLTEFIRPALPQLEAYQHFLSFIDVTAAKAKHARSLNAILPEIVDDTSLYFRDAYHPLLYLSNKAKNEKTYPQTIELSKENRIIVISGPNAGGKSITLKTIGLLQLMLQSGILIPVHERSKTCLFDRILTDIGDNQSIENHLSTYSYRLKNMNYFLKKVNKNTLFLIDEFGTGSDPELGGALAEAFLEEFYNREAFGIITTHYANLKLLANEQPFMSNANMQFDNRTLEPVFKLVVGEAGSSFTFEVAQKNGIPYSLINRAKKKIERGKVRFDATIAKLQKQRRAVEKTSQQLKDEESKAREEHDRLEILNDKMKTKLRNYQELYDSNQRMIYLGNKLNDIAEKYFIDKRKKPLIAELLRLVETENSKRKKTSAKQAKAEKQKKAAVVKEVSKEIAVVRKEKQKEKQQAKKQAAKPKSKPTLKVGDRVRMFDGKAIGSIDKLEKNKAVVNYGLFTTNVSVDLLELVEAKK
ncbi:endonuclease MutS2 [Spongiivirga citrea]|uniref:DNA mismatch repair protein MutS n=1 Tax=Spongiivirga citrea TaxID=1481457 RepID=A0A6M0CJL4_9FLAO|nr:DNA mismatch repair protein MutS [Spongiivirga citrea]NER15637.1 DNA mismatch repair protein MutS [Spongiivirga citrea]